MQPEVSYICSCDRMAVLHVQTFPQGPHYTVSGVCKVLLMGCVEPEADVAPCTCVDVVEHTSFMSVLHRPLRPGVN